MVRKEYLYSRDSKGKVRVSIFEVKPEGLGYAICRSTGLLTGKLTVQPDKIILKGKVKRTIEQQVDLELNSLINKQKDKGYIALDHLVDKEAMDLLNPMDHDLINELLSKDKKDASGQSLPMLAQDANKKKKDTNDLIKDPEGPFFKRAWWISAKIDGVRTLGTLAVDEEGEDYISFTSRTGKPYGPAVRNFDRDPELIQFMKDNECEIDGEIYCHGLHLDVIRGDAAKQTYVPERHDRLSFYIFDIAKLEIDATERVKILNKTEFKNDKITVLKHTYCISYKEILALHDKYVSEGLEGAMARTSDGYYEFGKRSQNLWKFKLFEDSEFKIIGTEEGARPEDMCFTMITDDGKEFNCKPIGGADMVQYYRNNLDTIIGQKGTVKYFGWTSKGIPNIAKFKCLKIEDE